MKTLLIAGLCAALAGCAGPFVQVRSAETVGAGPMEQAGSILTATPDQARTMTDLGEVTGHSCKNKIWDATATSEAAAFQLKVGAAQRGATRITEPVCTAGGLSIITNCWHSFSCTARALK